ncbi:hypothetical protein BC939DRAFT_478054 [Gamsiella multidivaricata]|uniref:uncharacterized protein n=1 Tax=Gamsiella multidivaricata TaxID=101098 RepID=UPI00221E5BEF|nr:uncharacterized protein BC939DRAFT_478054 [Gamsiella multidivaricata]KAI7821862.1 hypothetical protein BC939DRAFT_478054 [Gamsiella multidivaricata]
MVLKHRLRPKSAINVGEQKPEPIQPPQRFVFFVSFISLAYLHLEEYGSNCQKIRKLAIAYNDFELPDVPESDHGLTLHRYSLALNLPALFVFNVVVLTCRCSPLTGSRVRTSPLAK